jgi:protein-L-isoaspartate O-methyltransferase
VNALDLDWERYAGSFAATLAEGGADGGELCSAELRAAFAAVPRHVFVPRAYRRDDRGRWTAFDTVEHLETVYSREELVTELNGQGRPFETGAGPRRLAALLQALDLRDGHHVLEIGTGSGYAAALLAHRLGEEQVFATDPRSDVVDRALAGLALAGVQATVLVAPRDQGFAGGGPYDRILVSGPVSAVPWEWAQQLVPGGLLLVPLVLGAEAGCEVLLRHEEESLEGRFLPQSADDDIAEQAVVEFVARLRLPADAALVSGARALWASIGSPGWERFGLTVLPDGFHRVWLDDPDGDYRWTLPRRRTGASSAC